jgi:threonine/homoserine/homoserine lactone efflux protein
VTLAVFALAALALLVSPGPTNTLLFVSGAGVGLRASLRLIPAELIGYLSAIIPLALFGRPFLAAHPRLEQGVAVAASLWVLSLAFSLWRTPREGAPSTVTFRRVLVTTMINPKALVIALVLLPPAAAFADLVPALLLFAGMVVAVASCWIAGGAGVGRAAGQGRTRSLRRVAAGYLAFVAAMVLSKAV